MTTGGAGDLAAPGGAGGAALQGTPATFGAAQLAWPLRPHQERALAAFERAWHGRVSPGPMLFTGSPEGAGILTAQRGDDPFAVTTQIRTLWR